MELSMPTIVIKALQYQNSNSEFSLTLSEISWYGTCYEFFGFLFVKHFPRKTQFNGIAAIIKILRICAIEDQKTKRIKIKITIY